MPSRAVAKIVLKFLAVAKIVLKLLLKLLPFRGASKKCLGTPSSLVPRRLLGSSKRIAAQEHV